MRRQVNPVQQVCPGVKVLREHLKKVFIEKPCRNLAVTFIVSRSPVFLSMLSSLDESDQNMLVVKVTTKS